MEPQPTPNPHEHLNTELLNRASIKKPFPFGIYVHWPFCLSKCPYCDFFSKVQKNAGQDDLIKQYLDDLDYYAEFTGHKTVTSIFFGGGTPSLLKPQNIEKILNTVARNWKLSSDIEISLEANPNTHTPTLFSELKQAGINRLSLGVQSLCDKELKFLGRTHTSAQALYALEEICRLFDNASADLIYALPGQDEKKWQQNLERLLNFPLKHLSLYQLTIEEKTVFAKKGIKPMAEEQAAEFYQMATLTAADKGFGQYEVSNYAQPGFACRHNLLYWQGDDYLGIGQGAHGRLTLPEGIYAQTFPRILEKLTSVERAEELVLMGLRLTAGISKKQFRRCCGLDLDSFINRSALCELQKNRLLTETAHTLKATRQGFLLLNYLIEKLCS